MSLDLCTCGHHKDTHYLDCNEQAPTSKWRGRCLGMHCDCPYYNEPRKRDTPVLPAINFPRFYYGKNKPHVDTTCGCQACLDWEFHKLLSGSP